MLRLLSIVIDFGYVLAALLYLPVVLYRAIFAGRYHRGWGNRFGFVPKRYGDRPCIWVHAVSVGEVNQIRTLVTALRQQLPFHELFISTTTDTGYLRGLSLFGADRVFFFPFDFWASMALAYRRLKPSMVVLVELEVWPHLVIEAKRRSVPVVVINGRLTERAVRRYLIVAPLARWIFRQLDLVMVQDETYRQRFLRLGVDPRKIIETGSLKWDAAKTEEDAASLERALATTAKALGLDRTKPILVAGSTADTIEEEAIIRAYQQLRVHHPNLQLVVAPRKPERFDHVAKLIKARGFKVVRRSEHPDGTELSRPASLANSAVVLLDTIGELRRLYAMATVVIVGRTFVPLGGSDVMEIAALGKAIVLGPHVDNFADAVGKLVQNEAAIQLESPEKLAPRIEQLLADRPALDAIGARAEEVVKAEQGATDRTVRRLCERLGFEYDATGRAIATAKLEQAAP